MRYLKTYEKLIRDLISDKDIVELINTECSEWSIDDPIINRGFLGVRITRMNNSVMIYEPFNYDDKTENGQNYYEYKGKQYRASAYTGNFYTMLINHLEAWSDYPKRELICSNVQVYGGEYRVIPYNGSKWGVVPTGDIQNNITYEVNGERYTSLDELNDNVLNDADAPYEPEKFFKWLETSEFDFNRDLEPEKLGFKTFNYPELRDYLNTLSRERELWTDSKCILIKHDYFNLVIKPFL